MRTIIAGSRGASWEQVSQALDQCPWRTEISLVVSGTAKGADTWGECWAAMNKIPVKKYPADWDSYGKKAGILRNIEMGANADALVAVWDGQSYGTKHMIGVAESAGLTVFVYRTNEEICK